MHNCKICGGIFRDSYNLSKHLARKKPCLPKTIENDNNICNVITPNTTKIAPNEFKIAPNEFKDSPNEFKDAPNEFKGDPNKSKTKCRFCLNIFASTGNLKRHTTICKFRDDPVRLLEIENDIIPDIPECKTECRFCNHTFFNVGNLNKHIKVCKERLDYQEKLLKRKNEINSQVNNITNNNNNSINTTNNNNNGTVNNNNITINVFGQESIDHISNDEFMKYLIKNFKNYDKLTDQDSINVFSGNLVLEFERMMSANPQNQNSLLTNIKAEFGLINNRHYRFQEFVEKVLSNAAKKLSEREDLFSETSDKDITFSSLMLSDAREYTNKDYYKNLPKKTKKEINDSLRIQKA
jgi:hypothetical protein